MPIMTTYQTDMAIRLDAVSEDIKVLADKVEHSELSNEEFSAQIVEIIADLAHMSYVFNQR